MRVYFIQSGSYIKIGKANDPVQRLADLQTGSPLKLILLGSIACRGQKHAEYIEKQAHKVFRRWRARGEWYRDHPVIREWISRIGSLPAEEAAEQAWLAKVSRRKKGRNFMPPT